MFPIPYAADIARYTATAAAASLIAVGVAHAEKITKEDYKAVKAEAKATFEKAEKECKTLSGNAKDVCVLQAKVERVKSEASAEARYKNSPKAAYEARLDIAKANEKLANEMCDDKIGNEKDVCKKQAKETYVVAKSDAKARMKSQEAWQDAAEAKADAAYKTDKEKCDALSGSEKDACQARVKANHGR